MVAVKKFSALAAISLLAATGASANLERSQASHVHNQRSLSERHPHPQKQKQPSLIKVQKRLGPEIGDGLGGIINGLGKGLGLTELDAADANLPELRRGLVGDLLGAGGAPSTPSSANSPAPATSNAAPSNTPALAPVSAPASNPAPAQNQPASLPAANTNNNNQDRPITNAPSNNVIQNSGENGTPATPAISVVTVSASPQVVAASPLPTGINATASAVNATTTGDAAASLMSAAQASLVSAASASQASVQSALSAFAASVAGASSRSIATSGAVPTGVNTSTNNNESSGGSDGNTKVVVPIAVIAGSIAVIAVAWTLYRRYKKRGVEYYDRRMRPVDHEYHHRSMAGLAAGGAAFAVGGAADGLKRDRPRRESIESFEAGRPMSTYSHEGEFHSMPPPMQEVAPYTSVGGAYAPAPASNRASRIRNYGSSRGGTEDIPASHRVTDSMYIDDYARSSGAATPFSDEHGAYDVNQYDAASSYNKRASSRRDTLTDA